MQVGIKDKINELMLGSGFKPAEDWPHNTRGLPDGVRFQTKERVTNVSGVENIVITTTEVAVYAIPTPYNYTEWRKIRSAVYNSKEELVRLAEEFGSQPKGCW